LRADANPISTVRVEIRYKVTTTNAITVLKAHTATGGRGSGGTTDPLQSQGSLTLSHDHNLLFAINSGSGTISSFHLLGGLPILADQEPTGGAFPVAVAERNGTVYVLNAGGNGAIVAFRADGLGRLQQIPNATATLTASNSGGSSISVSPNGKMLVVIEKTPSNIDTFPIQPDGTLGSVVVNHSVTPGVFSTSFTPNGQLIVSEDQPDGTDVSSISSYTINANGTITAISQSLAPLAMETAGTPSPQMARSSTPTTLPPPRSQASPSAPTHAYPYRWNHSQH
jgi:6-phosphogluconolactonase